VACHFFARIASEIYPPPPLELLIAPPRHAPFRTPHLPSGTVGVSSEGSGHGRPSVRDAEDTGSYGIRIYDGFRQLPCQFRLFDRLYMVNYVVDFNITLHFTNETLKFPLLRARLLTSEHDSPPVA
jgi:hypothetical protein